jgi:hypothetical protein
MAGANEKAIPMFANVRRDQSGWEATAKSCQNGRGGVLGGTFYPRSTDSPSYYLGQ